MFELHPVPGVGFGSLYTHQIAYSATHPTTNNRNVKIYFEKLVPEEDILIS